MRELALILALILPPGAAPAPSGSPGTAATPGGTSATAAPSAVPKEVLREIGNVHATTRFCQEFTTRFNNSAHAMLENDRQLAYTYHTMGTLEAHYQARGAENIVYEDRVNLLHYADQIFKTLPGLQAEINALRQTASLTTDPARAKAAHDVAAQLQKSYDRQRALAVDSLSVAQAMTEVSLEHHPDPHQTPVYGGFDGANTVAPLPEMMRDVRTVLKFDSQLDRIGDAESGAVRMAQQVVETC
jgi:hypothetical protein